MRLYDYLPSGNGYKVRLVLAQLGIKYELIERDILKNETRTAEFLAMNANGRIPLLQLDDGRYLAESNAIIHYLAEGTPLIPQERFARAEMLQWMFFEQYSHEPYVAVARFLIHRLGRRDADAARLKELQERGYAALGVMEKHLSDRAFFVGESYSLADVSLYAYTHVAGEGDFDLARFPKVRAWLGRVAAQPRHVRITDK